MLVGEYNLKSVQTILVMRESMFRFCDRFHQLEEPVIKLSNQLNRFCEPVSYLEPVKSFKQTS